MDNDTFDLSYFDEAEDTNTPTNTENETNDTDITSDSVSDDTTSDTADDVSSSDTADETLAATAATAATAADFNTNSIPLDLSFIDTEMGVVQAPTSLAEDQVKAYDTKDKELDNQPAIQPAIQPIEAVPERVSNQLTAEALFAPELAYKTAGSIKDSNTNKNYITDAKTTGELISDIRNFLGDKLGITYTAGEKTTLEIINPVDGSKIGSTTIEQHGTAVDPTYVIETFDPDGNKLNHFEANMDVGASGIFSNIFGGDSLAKSDKSGKITIADGDNNAYKANTNARVGGYSIPLKSDSRGSVLNAIFDLVIKSFTDGGLGENIASTLYNQAKQGKTASQLKFGTMYDESLERSTQTTLALEDMIEGKSKLNDSPTTTTTTATAEPKPTTTTTTATEPTAATATTAATAEAKPTTTATEPTTTTAATAEPTTTTATTTATAEPEEETSEDTDTTAATADTAEPTTTAEPTATDTTTEAEEEAEEDTDTDTDTDTEESEPSEEEEIVDAPTEDDDLNIFQKAAIRMSDTANVLLTHKNDEDWSVVEAQAKDMAAAVNKAWQDFKEKPSIRSFTNIVKTAVEHTKDLIDTASNTKAGWVTDLAHAVVKDTVLGILGIINAPAAIASKVGSYLINQLRSSIKSKGNGGKDMFDEIVREYEDAGYTYDADAKDLSADSQEFDSFSTDKADVSRKYNQGLKKESDLRLKYIYTSSPVIRKLTKEFVKCKDSKQR